MRKNLVVLSMTGLLVGGSVGVALADPLPDNCDRERGTVTCTTFSGPGKNQAGIGMTIQDDTQGNLTNKSPEPQGLRDDACVAQKPPTSQGQPIACE